MDFEKLSHQQKQMIELLEHKIERYHVEVEGVMDRLVIAEKRIKEKDAEIARLNAAIRAIHNRAHEWNNVPACSDIEVIAAEALELKRGV